MQKKLSKNTWRGGSKDVQKVLFFFFLTASFVLLFSFMEKRPSKKRMDVCTCLKAIS